MNKKYLLLASELLYDYADSLGMRGCNDWDFPDDWSRSEQEQFVKYYHEYNGDPEEYDPEHLLIGDFCVADLLSHILGKMAEDE